MRRMHLSLPRGVSVRVKRTFPFGSMKEDVDESASLIAYFRLYGLPSYRPTRSERNHIYVNSY